MLASRWRRTLGPRARRALELFAGRQSGVRERPSLARGSSRRTPLGLVKQGLATLTYEKARGTIGEAGKMRITAAGRNAPAAEV
jgi:hypothetical protein